MRDLHIRQSIGVSACLCVVCVATVYAQRPDYPATRTEAVTDVVHGISITDSYRWLENSSDPEVQAWTERQNAFTRQYLDQPQAARQALTDRLTALYSPATVSSPRVRGQCYFYTKRAGDQNHAVVYMKEGAIDAAPRPVLNPNEFSKDGTVSLDWVVPFARWITDRLRQVRQR